MKIFVFLRGIDTGFKRSVSNTVMSVLNPDLNNVEAFRVSMNDYGNLSDKFIKKSASTSCKNLARKVLSEAHNETFIVVDNESLNPMDWQSYFAMANGINVNAIAIGIEVISPENFINDDQIKDLNLQVHNIPIFKDTMYKYMYVKSLEDLDRFAMELSELRSALLTTI